LSTPLAGQPSTCWSTLTRHCLTSTVWAEAGQGCTFSAPAALLGSVWCTSSSTGEALTATWEQERRRLDSSHVSTHAYLMSSSRW
jgi:hypothetical protein